MNAESAGQDPEISQRPFVRLPHVERKPDRAQVEVYNEEYTQNDPYLIEREGYNSSTKNLSPANLGPNPGRNKRKNFNPRYTCMSPTGKSDKGNDENSEEIIARTSSNNHESRDYTNRSPKSPASPRSFTDVESLATSSAPNAGGFTVQHTELTPWMQMFNHYDQLVKAAGLAQYGVQSGSGFHEDNDRGGNIMHAAVSDVSEWVRKFGSGESAVSAIRSLIKTYQVEKDKETGQDGNGSVNLTEPEPPTPPTTPHNCNSARPIMPNGTGDYPDPPAYHSPPRRSFIKEETLHPSPPPLVSTDNVDKNYPNVFSTNKRESPMSENVPHTRYEWTNDSSPDCSHEAWKKKESSGDENEDYSNKARKTEPAPYNSYHDDSSDYCNGQQTSTGSSSHRLQQWCDDFQKTPESFHKMTKSECDRTETTVGEADNNIYDEDDYSPSVNDFPDSANYDDDDDDNSSTNMFCDDGQSTPDDQIRITCDSETDQNAMESTADADQSRNLGEEKEGNCSTTSSKISVRNLGGFFEKSQLKLVPSKSRGGIDEKSLHSDVPNMSKFTSYIDCQNEMCRLENLREHYHCYDFPCFGKILSKKEEVIRHVKWHRKRVESLNNGFMRFSSSDDCSTTFGSNCQHNRKQTHYHCFQPNCDRVYISTSDVQMHSNFHRKDSAIHKEGFQRFRANEECSADYCMFAGQKTTHFHCRRGNCRYTFKNKADMEKHKTYHIKDLKLARDGFKKFFKNEPCPYKQCRFSKVCNHIHCARENCFYVLHSSGQLLSHKRKHERIDNEQTYCRYKMLAVKAALLGNAAATRALSPDIAPYKFTNSLMHLRELEINAFIPRPSSELSLPSPKLELYNKDWVTESPSSSSLSIEFLQQIKKRHEEILQEKNHLNPEPTVNAVGATEVTILPGIQQTASSQQQNNIALDPAHLTPAIIEQFFSTECLTGKLDNDEPINLQHLSPSDEQSQKVQKPLCPLNECSKPHLHCIFKDCEAVILNNVLDISAHIRLHGYNRDATATAAAPEQQQCTSIGTSSSPMQITTIDGFFNRKRGRPPKNRFVEVYKNAQQSPQAIFTSFKLEKQTMFKDCSVTNEAAPSPSYNQATNLNISAQNKGQSADGNRLMNNMSPQSSVHVTRLVQNPIASQFTTHRVNEHCGIQGGRCSLTLQHHYHCACSPDCTFVTVERDLLSVHLERQHTAQSFADTISKKFKRFDRNIGLDCGITECRLRKTRPHLHCRQCYRQISPFDLETHVCGNSEQRSVPSTPTKKFSTSYSSEYRRNDLPHSELSGENFTIHSEKNLHMDYTRLPSVTFSTLTELRRKVSEMEPETSSHPKRNHEDEKVLVVRAAGTYFPENTSEIASSSLPAQQKTITSSTATESIQGQITPSNSGYCSSPYCKVKRKPHEHCEFCDQSFVDPAKSKIHRLKHFANTTKSISSHLLLPHSTEASEVNKQKSPRKTASCIDTHPTNITPAYDEQPQDLSLSPSATNSTQDDGMKSSREMYATTPIASRLFSQFPNKFPPDLMCSISTQNFHLAQLATLYQQNPFYYQHLYPFLSNAAVLTRYQQHRQAQSDRVACSEVKPYLSSLAECPKLAALSGVPPLPSTDFPPPSASGHFTFLNPLLMARTADSIVSKQPSTIPVIAPGTPMPNASISSMPSGPSGVTKSLKRKFINDGDDFSAFIEALSPSTKKQMQFAAGIAAAAAAATGGSTSGSSRSGSHEQHGQHFKIKDEQIPTGYLKFRFNEDCYFPKCGYRNHQSHFHCDRNDCHYSFCDKTRFVQHTARHERLDKLMGNDFRQYRANMNCGYENCPYFKNMGSANKSSHFHCLKCDFICSDTNKVVAHRRQHSKMEYIRMAGFRKVTNSEKCNSTFELTVPTSGNEVPGTTECSYSQKQTHYHCLVCDVSVLSRAQLASHKHKT